VADRFPDPLARGYVPRRPRQLSGALIAALSGTVALVLSSVVILIGVMQTANSRTVIIPTPTPSPTATLTPTPTLPAIPVPAVGLSAQPPPQFEAYVADPTTGRVLYQQHSTVQQPMASTTKIMTALVAIIYGNPNQVITVPNEADATYLIQCCQASVMGIHAGQQYTLKQLLYGLLLPSGDDAATAIADGMMGSQAAYVARMNAVAQWLGLTHTHYADVHGLDAPGHYTTAADLARLAEVAMTLPLFRQIVATPAYSIAATATHPYLQFDSTNVLLQDAKALGIDGIKTGYTGGPTGAGYCVVLHAAVSGHQLVVVIMGDGVENARFTDGEALIIWGFKEEGLTVKLP
jgi:D-alanyl-D-alanine carboxypeptidase (penicillin-binding protein 5/6)